jgi:transposase
MTIWGIDRWEFPVTIESTLASDELWFVVEPLLPKHAPSPKGGAPRRNDRQCLDAILYVLRGGISWQLVPQKQFGVSGSTAWRRFRDWTQAGVWDEVHRKLLRELGERGELKTERVVIDSASVRALKGGRTPDPIRSIAASQAASVT